MIKPIEKLDWINSQESTKRTRELNKRALNMTYFESIKLFIISSVHMIQTSIISRQVSY